MDYPGNFIMDINFTSTFRRTLSEAFSDVPSLNSMHTLAACDYFDSYKVFPEDGINFNSNHFESNSEYWDFQTRQEVEAERNNRIVTIKSYHWSVVEPDYMERHWVGIHYATPYEFKFYLAAWLYSYLEYEEKMGVVSSCFLKFLENFLIDNSNSGVDFSIEQKFAIARFMIAVVQKENSESNAAKQCLDMGWWYSLDDMGQKLYLSI